MTFPADGTVFAFFGAGGHALSTAMTVCQYWCGNVESTFHQFPHKIKLVVRKALTALLGYCRTNVFYPQ